MFKYEKTKQEKIIDKQKGFDYCIYVMLSSYYKKAICLSNILETNLLLRYREINKNVVEDVESEAINVIEKFVLPHIPEAIEHKVAKVSILPWNNTYGCHGIQATTDNTVVTVYCKKEGKKKTTVFTVKQKQEDGTMQLVKDAVVVGNKISFAIG